MCADRSWRVKDGYREFLANMAMKCQQDRRLTPRQESKLKEAFVYYGQWEQEKKMPMFVVEKKRQIKLLKKLDDIIKSDIVLLGVSRTSKTPTSMYLAKR